MGVLQLSLYYAEALSDNRIEGFKGLPQLYPHYAKALSYGGVYPHYAERRQTLVQLIFQLLKKIEQFFSQAVCEQLKEKQQMCQTYCFATYCQTQSRPP